LYKDRAAAFTFRGLKRDQVIEEFLTAKVKMAKKENDYVFPVLFRCKNLYYLWKPGIIFYGLTVASQ
jgi:hypothetical protein